MTIIHLDSNPNYYVVSYRWEAKDPNPIDIFDFTNGKDNSTFVTRLSNDSQDDVLIVHGSEIKGNLIEKLRRSLLLPEPVGIIRVNCNGVCYFRLREGGKTNWQTPVDDGFRFDWSVFGVTVPNSANNPLAKKLSEQEKINQELNQQISELKTQLRVKETIASEIEPIKAKMESIERTLNVHNKQLEKVSILEREVDLSKLKLLLSQSISKFTEEAMNRANKESSWNKQEITALMMEIARLGRVSQPCL